MTAILPFECSESASEQESRVAAALLGLADAHGLYSGLYLHFGHARSGPVRAVASSPVARRRYVDLLAGSSLIGEAQTAYRPFAWSSRDVDFGMPVDEAHAGIAVPVQDHVNGPGLVALIGLDVELARAAVGEHGPALSWTATEIHIGALQAVKAGQSHSPTAREMECLRLSAEGRTAAAIGASLGIAVRTVEFHLRNVAEKLGATSKVNAVAIAASRGLLRCHPIDQRFEIAG